MVSYRMECVLDMTQIEWYGMCSGYDAYTDAGRSNGAGGTVMIATGENTHIFYRKHIL